MTCSVLIEAIDGARIDAQGIDEDDGWSAFEGHECVGVLVLDFPKANQTGMIRTIGQRSLKRFSATRLRKLSLLALIGLCRTASVKRSWSP